MEARPGARAEISAGPDANPQCHRRFNRAMVAEMATRHDVLFGRNCTDALDADRASVAANRAPDPLYRRALDVATASYCLRRQRKSASRAQAGVIRAAVEAQVVFADADLDAAVNGLPSGVFAATGQTCTAGSRVLVADRSTTN
jgi:Aldehyde dehydrogenase family